MIKDVFRIFFLKSGCKWPQIKVPKMLLRNPVCRYSKPCKIETNGPRDLKSGLKWSLVHPLWDQRCFQNFFPKSGCKWPQILIKGQKVAPEPTVLLLKALWNGDLWSKRPEIGLKTFHRVYRVSHMGGQWGATGGSISGPPHGPYLR